MLIINYEIPLYVRIEVKVIFIMSLILSIFDIDLFDVNNGVYYIVHEKNVLLIHEILNDFLEKTKVKPYVVAFCKDNLLHL